MGQSKLYPGESRLEYGNAIYFIAIVSRHVLKIEKNASCLPFKKNFFTQQKVVLRTNINSLDLAMRADIEKLCHRILFKVVYNFI